MADRRGMTLLEVLIALSILSIAFVLMIRAHIQSYTLVARGDTMNRAVLLGESVCARMMAFGWTDIASRFGVDEGPPRLTYRAKLEQTPVAGLRKMVIRIYRDKDKPPLLTLERWMVVP